MIGDFNNVERKDPMNTIVFGGAGFIGAELIKRLCSRGTKVTLYDRNINKKSCQKESIM